MEKDSGNPRHEAHLTWFCVSCHVAGAKFWKLQCGTEDFGTREYKARVGDFGGWKQQDKLKDDSNNAQKQL